METIVGFSILEPLNMFDTGSSNETYDLIWQG